MIEIRLTQWADLSELRRIAIETQLDTFGAANTKENMEAFIRDQCSPTQFRKELKEPDSICYMAWEGKRAAGFARLRMTDEVETWLGKNTLELHRLYVTKGFQGKKVGARLMQQSIDYAREKNYEWLWLGVWEHNLKAQDFYHRWGFVRFSEHIFQMGSDAQTDWLLKLKL